jgi:hypothetical protein
MAPEPTQPPSQWTRWSIPGTNVADLDVDHISASSAEVTNKWCYTPTPCICLHGVQRVYFTFRQILEEGRGLSDSSGNTGYPSPGGNVAATVQGRDELMSASTDTCCDLPPEWHRELRHAYNQFCEFSRSQNFCRQADHI